MNTFFLSMGFALLSLTAPVSAAQSDAEGFAISKAAELSGNADIQSALRISNAAHANIDEAEILTLDGRWRDQVGATIAPDIEKIMSAPASAELRKIVEASGGKIVEIILMDNHGLNAAISSVTSDFWQGDEAKFQKTYKMGAGAVHVGDVEFDESTNTYVIQISFVMTDAVGMPIGAATFGLNAEAF